MIREIAVRSSLPMRTVAVSFRTDVGAQIR
jgi:hypothetical protein